MLHLSEVEFSGRGGELSVMVNVTERGNLTFSHDEREVMHTRFRALPASSSH